MKRFLINNLWWVTFILAVILLASHSLSLDKLKVDNTTIVLLLVLLVSPFVSAIKKIKFGEFEAEIDPKEVRRVKEEVEARIAEEEIREPPSPAIRVTEAIAALAEHDPVLALAKLRIEIEKVVSRLYERIAQRKDPKRPPSLGRMILDLARNDFLSPDIGHPLREVVSICNRAVHGEEIRSEDVESIIDTGKYLLEMLHGQAKSLALGDELESRIIDPSVVEEHRHARYRLTTLIPYAEDTPVQNVRILDQDGLDAFFEGYEEFAEFIIDLTRVDDSGAQQPVQPYRGPEDGSTKG